MKVPNGRRLSKIMGWAKNGMRRDFLRMVSNDKRKRERDIERSYCEAGFDRSKV